LTGQKSAGAGNGKNSGGAVIEADLAACIRCGALPKCPAGGKYTISKAGERPTCSIAGHALA
jgi:hypothetical protein